MFDAGNEVMANIARNAEESALPELDYYSHEMMGLRRRKKWIF